MISEILPQNTNNTNANVVRTGPFGGGMKKKNSLKSGFNFDQVLGLNNNIKLTIREI